MPAPHRYSEDDGDRSTLDGQRVAVVGYGNLGRPAALNLRDSGLEVVVGSRQEPDADRARDEGFFVLPLQEAVPSADVVWLALPDEVIPAVLQAAGGARLAPGGLVCFASGYPLAYGLVKLPDDVDAVVLAPRMIGERIRGRYLAGQGFYSYVAVAEDATGTARRRLLGLAAACGYALTAALMKNAMANLDVSPREFFVSWHVYATAAAGVGALFLLQNALQAGSLVASQPMLTVGDALISICYGVTLYGEHIRVGWWLLPELAALAVIISGCVHIAKSPFAAEAPALVPETAPTVQ